MLKALEKDRTRRYQAASELAADIRRHFHDEPVTAGPPGLGYRLTKAIHRHKLLFGAAAAVAAALVVGLAAATTQYFRAEAARRETRQQLVKALVSRGNELVDRADPVRALPWLVKALEVEEGDQTPHRIRIQSVLDHTPKLVRLWAHQGAINHAAFSPDGRLRGIGQRRPHALESGASTPASPKDRPSPMTETSCSRHSTPKDSGSQRRAKTEPRGYGRPTTGDR